MVPCEVPRPRERISRHRTAQREYSHEENDEPTHICLERQQRLDCVLMSEILLIGQRRDLLGRHAALRANVGDDGQDFIEGCECDAHYEIWIHYWTPLAFDTARLMPRMAVSMALRTLATFGSARFGLPTDTQVTKLSAIGRNADAPVSPALCTSVTALRNVRLHSVTTQKYLAAVAFCASLNVPE